MSRVRAGLRSWRVVGVQRLPATPGGELPPSQRQWKVPSGATSGAGRYGGGLSRNRSCATPRRRDQDSHLHVAFGGGAPPMRGENHGRTETSESRADLWVRLLERATL